MFERILVVGFNTGNPESSFNFAYSLVSYFADVIRVIEDVRKTEYINTDIFVILVLGRVEYFHYAECLKFVALALKLLCFSCNFSSGENISLNISV